MTTADDAPGRRPAADVRLGRTGKDAADRPADRPTLATQHIVVRDLTLSCSIGVSDEERSRRQRLRINLDLVVETRQPSEDRIAEVVNYGHLIDKVRNVCLAVQVKLLETLAERIAEACFLDARVMRSRIRIEKLDRYADVGGIGVEMEYRRDRR